MALKKKVARKKVYVVIPILDPGCDSVMLHSDSISRDIEIVSGEIIKESDRIFGKSILIGNSIVDIHYNLIFEDLKGAKNQLEKMRKRNFEYVFDQVQVMKEKFERLEKFLKI